MTNFERDNPGVEVLPPEGKALKDAQFPWKKVAIMALIMVLYSGSPIDIIPDFIPFFGLLDDFLVDAGLLGMIARAVFKYYSMKRAMGSKESLRRVVSEAVFKRAVPNGGKR